MKDTAYFVTACNPHHRTDYKVIGKLIMMRIVKGGPGFPVILPAAHHYFTTHEHIGQLVKDADVPDLFVLELEHLQ